MCVVHISQKQCSLGDHLSLTKLNLILQSSYLSKYQGKLVSDEHSCHTGKYNDLYLLILLLKYMEKCLNWLS